MSKRIYLMGVSALAGEQILEKLEDNPLTESIDVSLFDDFEQAGQSLMVGGKAHRVSPYAEADFAQAELVILCSPETPEDLIAEALGKTTVLDLQDHQITRSSSLIIAELNAADFVLEAGACYRSPEPSLLITALFLKNLAPSRIEPLRVTANLICPASLHDQAGIQALATETAHLLNGREASTTFLETPLAFNLLATPQKADEAGNMSIETLYEAGLAELIDPSLEVAVTVIQAPVFHGTAITLVIETQNRIDKAELINLIDRNRKFRYSESTGASTQSLIGVDQCLVSRLRVDAADEHILKLTLLLDEQRLGRAANAVAIIESLTTRH